MTRMLAKASNWKVILPLFLLFALFSFFLFPNYQSRMSEAAGESVTGLDTRFSYTAEEVRTDFEKLGARGRDVYQSVVQIDMIYPLIYGMLFILVLSWLLKKLFQPDSPWMLLALIPCVGVLFDYLENINTLKLLKTFPNISADAVAWGERMTQLKHGFGLLSVALAITLGMTLLLRKFR